MQDLFSIQDPDWKAYIGGDPEFALRSTGATIRKYCGWHIFPSVTETIPNLEVGSQGTIMLPSLYVTDVSQVTVQGNTLDDPRVVDPAHYTWFQNGYIEPTYGAMWYSGWYAGFYYEPGPYFLPQTNLGLATVTMTHGYESVPDDIKRVAFELAGLSNLMPAGNVKEIASPGFRLVTDVNAGMNLNPEQKNRLAPYRIGGVK